jgi:resuscitation-promoting factor RpfB
MPRNFLIIFGIFVLLAACTPQAQQVDVSVTLITDVTSQVVTLPTGSSVQQALDSTGIRLSQTDRVYPPPYTLLVEGLTIKITRVSEEFETQQVIIPYDRQELHNESLPDGETRLVQAGQNGLREITIRHVFENDLETSSSIVSEKILRPSTPEIVMIGVQSPFAPLPIPGKLAFLTGGNAWIMDISTSNRHPIVTTADLDGHIFSLSPDGKWLLFTRKSDLPADQEINTLWVVNTEALDAKPISLKVSNVVHFAAWQPGQLYEIAYSTVEPRNIAPGWQANNDLHFLHFANWEVGRTEDVLESNSGGIYGWWGMTFSWSPDGQMLVYARPDGIGLVDIANSGLTSLLNITPLNTHSDWAWTPGLAWGSDSQSVYTVSHSAPTGLVSPEDSPNFDLNAISLTDKQVIALVPQAGMFAYPAVASFQEDNSGLNSLVAFMQAIFPTQSASSRYRLEVMNNDGTNIRLLFPSESQAGLQPQTPLWAPRPLETGEYFISVIYEGNLWIVDATSGQFQQVTGDGLTVQLDWK